MSLAEPRVRRNIIRQNSRSLLEQTIRRSELREIELTWPDHGGHARGRRLPASSFVGRVIESGLPVDPGSFRGAGSREESPAPVVAVADSATFRRLPWRERTGHVIADIVTPDRDVVPTPRSVLRTTVDHLSRLGLSAVIRATPEGYALTAAGTPLAGPGRRDSLSGANRINDVLEPLTAGLAGFVPVAAVATTDGPGGFAVTLPGATPLDAADDAFRLVYALDELSRRSGSTVTLATPDPSLPPTSMHLQVSLWSDDQPVFGRGAREASGIGLRVTDGVRNRLPALTLFSSSFDGTEAGEPVTWEADPRPIDDEPLHDWPAAAQVGLRVAATAEPHWAVASLLAAVVIGLDPEAATDADGSTERPASLADAIDVTTADEDLVAILGRDAVTAYAAHAQSEWLARTTDATRTGIA